MFFSDKTISRVENVMEMCLIYRYKRIYQQQIFYVHYVVTYSLFDGNTFLVENTHIVFMLILKCSDEKLSPIGNLANHNLHLLVFQT